MLAVITCILLAPFAWYGLVLTFFLAKVGLKLIAGVATLCLQLAAWCAVFFWHLIRGKRACS